MVAPPISALDKNACASYGGLVPGHNHGRYLPLVSGLEMSFFLVRIIEDSPITVVGPLRPSFPFVGTSLPLIDASSASAITASDKGPYLVRGKPLVLKLMPNFFDFIKPDKSLASIWVRFPSLRLECWSSSCLFKIAKVIGNPMRCNDPITIMSRLSFARIFCTKCQLSGHTSNAYLNNSTSTEAHPSPGMTKKMYVSPSGSLEDMALKGSILSSPHVASLSCHQDSGNVIDDPSAIDDPPQDASLIQSKRPYMTRSKSLFIPSDTLISVVNIASRRPS
ncbi:hypothetical protein NC653_008202 [Populus alba x Populus x berolinensis]|uniref:DUF4283 domain-containing protein n=1 Tax=Populus alba x Populus x berolinensis TaxID=444605 RepID=A0AAD6W9P8_9ROSI|nr:hypothetical protein NC653_008202 [Populus alba x Populus x berolinensis]